MSPRRAATTIVTVLLLSALPAQAYQPPGRTTRVSVTASGEQFEASSTAPVLSGDGETVAFWSRAPLVPDDTNDFVDVYVRDLRTGEVERVSVASDGTQASTRTMNPKTLPAVSSDGRLVAFELGSAELVPGDTNGVDDVFVHDRQTGETWRASVTSGGQQAAWHSQMPSFSGDDRYLFFLSEDDTLVAGDESPYIDLFRKDLATGALELVTRASDGEQSVFDPTSYAVNQDGNVVTWSSRAPTHQAPDVNGIFEDVFVRDIKAGVTERVSDAPGGVQANNHSFDPAISGDGRLVAFGSLATNIVPGDSNGKADVFVHDRVTDRTQRVSVDSSGIEASQGGGNPAISGDGRLVAFNAIDLAGYPDANGTTDIYIHDLRTGSTTLASVNGGGVASGDGISHSPALSADGGMLAFNSEASDLVAGDGNLNADAFVRELGPALGIGELVAGADGSVDGWGRFAGLVSEGTDPVGDATVQTGQIGGDLVAARMAWRPEEGDLYLRADLANLPSVPGTGLAGVEPIQYRMSFSYTNVAFQVRAIQAATSLTVTLHRCTPVCVQVGAPLRGSLGQAGLSFTTTVPIQMLDVPAGARLHTVSFSTSFSSPAVNSTGDSMALPDLFLEGPRVELGVADPAAPGQDVVYDRTAGLSDGRFAGNLGPLGSGAHAVWARACLGAACGAASKIVSS